jgi:class 3 adenylate cyclase
MPVTTKVKMNTAQRSFMFVDLTSYSNYVSRNAPEAVSELLCEYYSLLETAVGKFAAEIIDSAGDGVAIMIDGEQNVNRAYDLALEIDRQINKSRRIPLGATITLDFGPITAVENTKLRILNKFYHGNTLNRVGRMAPMQSRLGVKILTTDEFRMQLSLERRSQFKFYRKIAFRGFESITSLYYVKD